MASTLAVLEVLEVLGRRKELDGKHVRVGKTLHLHAHARAH